MKLRLLTTILATSLLFSCNPCRFAEDFSMDILQSDNSDEEEDDSIPVFHCEEMTAVVQEASAEFKYNNGLFLQDAKTYYDDGIHTVQLRYRSQNLIQMCEARELIVLVVETLLAKLNQDILLGPEFTNYPFTADNLEIYITFGSYFGRYVDYSYTSWIGLEDGGVTYYTFNLKDNRKNCWDSRRESYSKAREIVVYEKQAEQKYRENNRTKRDIFGGRRFFSEP